MKNIKLLSASIFLFPLFFTISCNKDEIKPARAGQYNIGRCTWQADDTENSSAVHFYATRKNVTLSFLQNEKYHMNYISTQSGTGSEDEGKWSYDKSSKIITMTPNSGAPYSFRIVSITSEDGDPDDEDNDDNLKLTYQYNTYNERGIIISSGEENISFNCIECNHR